MKLLSQIVVFVILPFLCYSKTWQVGPDKEYKKPSEVMSLVADGDIVEIDSGIYNGDVGVWNKNNLTIRGTGGLAHLMADGNNSQGKGIWVIKGDNTTVEYIEFSGASVQDKNGAGIRQEGAGLTIKNCFFHDNENGILAGENLSSDIIIENTEFASNGYGDGYSHNIYIGHVRSFTLKFSYSHHANIGHNVKSRAEKNIIIYNRIMDQAKGRSSMLLDLPNGGLSLVMGNSFMQGRFAKNKAIITYGVEGLSNSGNRLYVINNTLLNKRRSGTFVTVETGTEYALAANNIFCGTDANSSDVILGEMERRTNLFNVDEHYFLFDNVEEFDFGLSDDSPAVDQGSPAGDSDDFNLTPEYEYVHPLGSRQRPFNGPRIDPGAYESGKINSVHYDGIANKLICYPNPFSDFTTIELSAPDGIISSISIIVSDIFGRTVQKLEYPVSESYIIPRGGLITGVYFFRVAAGGKIIGVGDMIVE